MTIKKGQDWGKSVNAPITFDIAETDRTAAAMNPSAPFALSGGDVFHSLGSPLVPKPAEPCRELQIDAIKYQVFKRNGDVIEDVAFAHICIGSWFIGRFIAITNCGFVSDLNTSPRAHVNDGELDIFRLNNDMSLRQRYLARLKAKTGSHLPHPKLESKRSTVVEVVKLSRNETLSIDGHPIKDWSSVSVHIAPDYWSILV